MPADDFLHGISTTAYYKLLSNSSHLLPPVSTSFSPSAIWFPQRAHHGNLVQPPATSPFSAYFWFTLRAWKVGRIMWHDWKQPMGDMDVMRKKNVFGCINLPQLSLALISKLNCPSEFLPQVKSKIPWSCRVAIVSVSLAHLPSYSRAQGAANFRKHTVRHETWHTFREHLQQFEDTRPSKLTGRWDVSKDSWN